MHLEIINDFFFYPSKAEPQHSQLASRLCFHHMCGACPAFLPVSAVLAPLPRAQAPRRGHSGTRRCAHLAPHRPPLLQHPCNARSEACIIPHVACTGGIICSLVGDKRPRCPGRGSCTGSCRHGVRGGRHRLLSARSELVSSPPLTCGRGWPACGRSGCGCWGSPALPGSCKAKAGQGRLGAAGLASVLRGWGRRGTHRDCSWGRLSNCPGKISFKGL